MSHGTEIVPKYSHEEMKNEMSKYGVEITPSTLKHPSTEDIQGVYSVCIKYILNKDINNIRIEEFTGDLKSSMPSIDGIQILPNEGKNHLQAIGNLRFIRYCEKINKILNLENNLSYIFKPISSHISKLIGAFIHFMKYREDIYNENEIKIRKIKDKKIEDAVLENELNATSSELHVLLGKHEEVKNSIVKEKNSKKNYEEEIIENQNLLNAQQSKIIALKTAKDKIVNETNELAFQFSRLRQKKEDLEDQIVPSPEKLQQYNEELKDLLAERMSHCESDKKKNEDVKQKITVADSCIKKLIGLFTVLTSHIDEIIKVHIEKKNELKSLGKSIKSLKAEKEDALQKKEDQDKMINETQLNYEEEERKWNQKIAEEESKIVEIENNVKYIYQNVDTINGKINRTINEIKSIMKFTEDTVNSYNRNLKILNDLIEKTRNSQVLLYDKISNDIRNFVKIKD